MNNNKNNGSKWTSRKLIVFGIFFLSSAALLFLDKISGGQLLNFWCWLAGLYFAGNAATKYIAHNGNSKGIK